MAQIPSLDKFKRFQPVCNPSPLPRGEIVHSVDDTHTVGHIAGKYKQVCTCTNRADAALVADALNHFFGE
jgi:hypothetical protein